MNSKLLLFVIASMITVSFSVSVFAEPGDLLFTIENPGLKRDLFSSSLDTINDLIIVGASAKEVDGVAFAGSLYVFDGITGDLKFTIDNPDPKRGDGFGRNMITTDNYIAVGLDIQNKNDVGDKGKIFVFDDAGLLLFTIENPNGSVYDEWFAGHLGSHGDKIIAGSNFQDSDGKWIYMTHVFDESGNLQHTLEDFESNTNTFGYSVSSFGDNIVVYAIDKDPNDDIHTNSVHVFDSTSGILQYVIENPDSTKGDFGRHIVEVQDNLVVGTPTRMWDEEISGTIHVFDESGELSFSIEYPESDISNVGFGGYLSAVGDNIALRSISDQTDHDYFDPLSDLIYVFDGKTGDQLFTIEEPGLQDEHGRSFIQYLDGTGSLVMSGLNWNDHNPQQRTIYIFEGTGTEEVLVDVSRDDAPFFGIFVYLDELFSWIMKQFGNEQAETSLTEKQIHESIQNEISKSPKITGVHAQNICKILGLECTSNKTFQAVFDSNDGYTKFTYSKLGDAGTFAVDYFFRTIDNELEYKTSRNPTEWITFGDDNWMWDDDLISNVSTQSKLYDYYDVCGFPATDEMRLDAIHEKSTDFTPDGMSFLKVRGGVFTHVELAQSYQYDYPSLKYWFTLKNGQQVYFQIGACNIDNPDVSMGKPGPDYLKIKPKTGESNFEQISVPGFPMVNTVTMQPMLDVENCQRMVEYYTKMQSSIMFTRENVSFDPLWKNQVFPLMDYCNDVGEFEMNVIDGKIEWSFI